MFPGQSGLQRIVPLTFQAKHVIKCSIVSRAGNLQITGKVAFPGHVLNMHGTALSATYCCYQVLLIVQQAASPADRGVFALSVEQCASTAFHLPVKH